MSFVNIHGQPVDWAKLEAAGLEQRRRERAAGVPGVRKATVKNGYAAVPGTGPKDETCKSCKFKNSIHNGAKHFIKCELRRSTWTHGEGTDILAGSPACSKWEKAE